MQDTGTLYFQTTKHRIAIYDGIPIRFVEHWKMLSDIHVLETGQLM